MRKIVLLTVFCIALFNFWPTHTHVYLVKLTEVPLFCRFADNTGVSTNGSIYVRNQNVWWKSGWDFDALLKANNARFEDLYPENNSDDDMGRWIVVRSKTDIASVLRDDTGNVEIVEDGDAIFSIERLERYPTYDANDDNPPVKDDKTWGLRLPMVQEGLDILKPTREIVVGVVDTGCDLKHPNLVGNLVQGHNFAGGDVNDPSNRASYELHATHVTGTIVAKKDSDGFFGIAVSVAKVMPIRVLNENGTGTATNVSRGVAHAANHGCHVINMSLGGSSYSKALHDAVKDAVNKGVFVVCAKGNSNSDKPHWPAEFPEVIRVTATSLMSDGSESRAPFSNYGKTSTCSAPGHFTYSTLPNGKYGFLSGTSMATPHATACVAVILSQDKFTPEQVKSIIENYGDKLCTDQPIGKRINLLNFIQKNHDEMFDPCQFLLDLLFEIPISL